MLKLDAAIIESIVEALQFVHKNNALPNPAPPGLTLANHPTAMVPAIVNIAYGVNNVTGTVQMTRGQFAITGVSLPAGGFNNNFNYNHSNTPSRLFQDYTDALSNNNLGAANGDQHRSAIIALTSESCRSNMVLNAFKKLASTKEAFPMPVWNGLLAAFQSYSDTATFRGYKIHAGEQPWTALNANDYLAYFTNRSKNNASDNNNQGNPFAQYIESINEVVKYINA